jgi:hypothetical protein
MILTADVHEHLHTLRGNHLTWITWWNLMCVASSQKRCVCLVVHVHERLHYIYLCTLYIFMYRRYTYTFMCTVHVRTHTYYYTCMYEYMMHIYLHILHYMYVVDTMHNYIYAYI